MNFFETKKALPQFLLLKNFKASLLLILFVQIYFLPQAQTTVRSKIGVQLLLNTNPGPQNTADGVVAFFADNFSKSVGNEDSYKFFNPDENLAIRCNETLLSIDGRPTIQVADTLKLVMWKFRQKSYYLKINASNFAPAIKAVVKDNYMHKEIEINLSSATLVPFNITNDSASFAKNRFSIVFKTTAVRTFSSSIAVKLSSVFKESKSVTVAPNPVTGNTISLQMNNVKKGKYTISLYTTPGVLVYSGFINYDGNSSVQKIVIDRRLHKGMYSLLLTCGDQTVTNRVLFQ